MDTAKQTQARGDALPPGVGAVAAAFADALGVLFWPNPVRVCLYGSCAQEDFREGWSDIDFIALTDRPLSQADADSALMLRQRLRKETGNPLFRSLEGAILAHDAFFSGEKTTVVYWGTGGQRVTDSYALDCFGRLSLAEHGVMVSGEDFCGEIAPPTYAELVAGVRRHYEAIRTYAARTSEKPTSAGWFLDIARGLHTLRTGQLTTKTAAAIWACEKGLVPGISLMEAVIALRLNPSLAGQGRYTPAFFASLGPHIQRFADVLEEKLAQAALHTYESEA